MKALERQWIRIASIALLMGLAIMSGPRPANAALSVWDSVSDFGQNQDRVTIRGALTNAPTSTAPSHFRIRVIVTDLRTGELHDSGEMVPTAVR